MGQNWQVINLDKRQRNGCWGKIPEFIWGIEPLESAAHKFVPVDLSSIIASSLSRRKKSPGLTIAQLLGSLYLPMEILVMTFDEINDFTDAFCLAYTNTYLLAAGKSNLWRLKGAHWASDRITQELLTFDDKGHWKNDDGTPNCTNLSRFAGSNYKKLDLEIYNPGLWRFMNKLLPYEEHCYCGFLEAPRYVTSDDLALCNLSKREYVCSKALEAVTGLPVHRPWLRGNVYDLGIVLLTRICWTSHPSLPKDIWLYQGAWAGDRFEITNMDAVNARMKRGEAWKDDSADVLEHIRVVLRGVYRSAGKPELETNSGDDDT
ncbi:hypothetical protein BOTBODRAFT_177216 [Botryobasidium botryosum FD-172 SS1]|uniref:Uncharacterized protein n=1 Tax=Botryobasidium botryosum (strain FD-172 SS1) TaxID=930990 RepID=A0A067MI90_BOTB1|nr:hypothetical protein BOTBODRAFT_177216 [Botryobasidium botryosum FD-172 SS1]